MSSKKISTLIYFYFAVIFLMGITMYVVLSLVVPPLTEWAIIMFNISNSATEKMIKIIFIAINYNLFIFLYALFLMKTKIGRKYLNVFIEANKNVWGNRWKI